MPKPGEAQVEQCPSWTIEVSAQPASNISLPTGCSDAGACSDLYYYVSLIYDVDPEATYPTAPYNFTFRSLSFSGKLSVTPGIHTNRILSRLDPVASQACSPTGVNASEAETASWDDDGTFSYSAGTLNGPPISWSVPGRHLLFVIAVRAFPGETVNVGSMSGDFQLVAPTKTENCFATIRTVGNLNKVIDPPAACTPSALTLRLGSPEAANVPGYPDSKRIPVFVNGTASSYSVQSLEFLIQLSSNLPMADISIMDNILSANNAVTLYNEGASGLDQRVYCSAQGTLMLPGGNTATPQNTLFYIVINGPALASECANINIGFIGPRRLKMLGSSGCCQPTINSISTLQFGIQPCIPNCGANAVLKVKKLATFPPNSDECGDLYFDLAIASSTPDGFAYESGQVVLDLTHDGTLSQASYLVGDVALNAALTSLTTTVVSPTVFRVIFNFAGNPLISVPGGNIDQRLATIALSGANVCIESIYFHDAVLSAFGVGPCVLKSISTEVGAMAGDALCIQNFSVLFEKQYGLPLGGIQGVDFTVAVNDGICAVNGISNNHGRGARCLCDAPKHTVTATKNDNPLNGVTTFDLVLISKHILGVDLFGNPYKMVAADANKSSTITAFDIVELRKLILGIYQVLPNNTSWRFIPQDFVFSNPANPFQTAIPENYFITVPPNPGLVKFYGIKVGDVNGSAMPSVVGAATDRDASLLPLGYALPTDTQRGEQTEIPLFVQQPADLAAWQLALRYDTAQWQVKGVRWAMSPEPTVYQWADWHSPVPGELRLCWFDRTGAATQLAAQAPLAYLQVERRGYGSSASPTALQLSPTMPGVAYGSGGEAANLALTTVPQYQAPAVVVARAAQPKPEWTVAAYPNPTGGLFRFEVSLPTGGEGRIGLYDPTGRLVAQHDCTLVPGLNVITSQQFPLLPTGLYFVRFDTPLGRQTLRLVKRAANF